MLAVASVLLTFPGTSAAKGSGGSAAIPIGFILPLTGRVSANANQEEEGFKYGLAHLGSSIDGHKLKPIYVDSGDSAVTALALAKTLISRDHVKIMEGPLTSSSIAAVSPYVQSKGIPEDDLNLSSIDQMNDYTKTGMGFSSGWNFYPPSTVGASWAFKTMHWNHVTVVASDFSYGWQVAGGFISELHSLGGAVDDTIWVPTNATDLSSYISQIPKTTQAVYVELSGSQAVTFVTDYAQFGLKTKIPLLGITTLFDQSVLQSMKKASALGGYADSQYCTGIATKANSAFVKAFRATTGLWPSYYSDLGYVKVEILDKALHELHGRLASAKSEHRLVALMKDETVTAPRGPLKISTVSKTPVENWYICKVETVHGAVREIPIKTYGNVQPWGLLSKATWMKDFAQQSVSRP